jgi:16S rRNA processing protein RimM
MTELDDWLEIGTIVAPQGLKGEMRVYANTDFPERFEVPGKRWLLRPGEKEPQAVKLLKGRYVPGKNLYIVNLAGVENCNQVEELRGCKLMVPDSDRPQLGEDEYHVADLIGMSVFLQESGELIGTVVDVIAAGNDLLQVKLHQQEVEQLSEEIQEQESEEVEEKSKIQNPKTILIPFVRAIAPVVNLDARRIEITPPDGLLEL